MTTTECYLRLIASDDWGPLYQTIEVATVTFPDGSQMDAWHFATVAAVRLTGRLELCESDADIQAAAEHYWRHLHGPGKPYLDEDVEKETDAVISDLMLAGVL